MQPLCFHDPVQEEALDRDGYVVAPGPKPEGLDLLRRLWHEVEPLHEGAVASTNPAVSDVEERRRIFREIEAVVDPVLQRLLSGYRLVAGGFVGKRGRGHAIEPHRHNAMVNEARKRALILWIPLEEATVERGCMTVAPGTHRERALTGHRVPGGEAVPVPMDPGLALVMDNRLLHGSLENQTEGIRVAVTVLAIPDGEPLWFCREVGPLVEIYRVPDDFYVSHFPGEPPEGAKPLGRVPASRGRS